jgi:N-acetyl-1-D-myo-inositol-2-amino-2-deoxy-alpha-D-glucopyranoside deacetylase
MIAREETAPMTQLLAVFAHPDDEAFTCGGVFAALTDRGVAITLVCATRGEAGEILVPTLATRETLGAVREGELRNAMEQVGVSDIRFLDYVDSGMIGTPENEAERAFMRAPEAEVVAKLRPIIDELRPEVVISFGPDGYYGHPDHLAIFRATTAAVLISNQPRALYYATAPRQRFIEMSSRPNNPFVDFSDEALNRMGTPREEITTFVNVRPWLERKRAAMAAHRTQFGDEGPLNRLAPDEVDAFLSTEHFVRVPLPWDDSTGPFDPLATLSPVSLIRAAG